MGCPETSAIVYKYTPRNIPKERKSHLYTGGSLILRKITFVQLLMNFHIVYKTWRLIAVFKTESNLSVSRTRLNHSSPTYPSFLTLWRKKYFFFSERHCCIFRIFCQVRHPRFVEYKLKYNIKLSYTTSYFIRLYEIIIDATCFGPIVGPSSGWSLNTWREQLIMFLFDEISYYRNWFK
jgi:hypothetical protein